MIVQRAADARRTHARERARRRAKPALDLFNGHLITDDPTYIID